MDVYNEFELEKMFGEQCYLGNKQFELNGQKSQIYSDYRQGCKAFLHCDDDLHWAHGLDQVLHSTFILALEVEFELALHQHDEGYDTDIYDLP